MTARSRRGAAAAIALVACVSCAGAAAPDLLLALAPALLLAVALVAQRYPGARLLERIAARRRARPRPARSASTPRTRPARAVRGGLLLARALAGRAPPVS